MDGPNPSPAAIERLERLYRALSQTNQAIVRARDRDALARRRLLRPGARAVFRGDGGRRLVRARQRAARPCRGEAAPALARVEHSPAATVITDTEGCIEYANPRFTEVSGYALKEDITERKRAELELVRVNRILRMVSECHQVLVLAKDTGSPARIDLPRDRAHRRLCRGAGDVHRGGTPRGARDGAAPLAVIAAAYASITEYERTPEVGVIAFSSTLRSRGPRCIRTVGAAMAGGDASAASATA